MDHVTLYNQLVWDAMVSPDVSTIGNNSVMVDGTMRGFLKADRVVLNFDADRVAELVAQNLGAVYEANAGQAWLAVDAGVDDRTFRRLFSEAIADRNVPRAAIARFVKEIAAEIRALPELSSPDWDTYSMVAEVSAGFVKVMAFRYTQSGPPVPTAAPVNDDLFRDLHDKTFGGDGEPWDVVLVKIRRDATAVQLTFSSGEAAEVWRVNPENLARLAESLRWLPGELPQPHNDSTASMAEISQAIAADILSLPELRDPDWDTYSMVAEVSDSSCRMTAYRYTESGPPIPTDVPENSYAFLELRNKTRGTNGEAWDVVLVKIHRDTANLVMTFASGESADRWRVNPQNIGHLPESLRPRPEDFQAVEDVEDPAKPVDSQPGPDRPEFPLLAAPVHANEDGNFVIGDRMNTKQSAAAWPEVSGHRHAVWAGRAVNGATGLLVRAYGSDPATRTVSYEAISLVRMSEVARRTDGGYQARLESVPLGPSGDLDGVIDRADLRELLRQAADRDPAFGTGWLPPRMRAPLPAPSTVANLAFSDVGEDLLRRLAMPLSTRIELMTRPERDRFQTLVSQLREVADGKPPEPERAQRLDRPFIDLPPHAIPVLAESIWLTPGNVSTIKASAFISDLGLAAGWLAFTSDLTVGRAVMVTRPLRRSDTAIADGRYWLTADQIRPAIIRAVVPGEGVGSLVELVPAPSASEAAIGGLPKPREAQQRLSEYLQLLRQAYARDTRVVGTASGFAYRLWQAGRFTSLRALMSWQIGQLAFGSQTVLDLQAIAWPDRLRALTLVLQGVADGRPLADMRAEAAGIAATALQQP